MSAIEAEQMGEDNITDFIAISYSSPDYIGHNFGPQSKEVQDTYIKLDAELSRLFNALDQKLARAITLCSYLQTMALQKILFE